MKEDKQLIFDEHKPCDLRLFQEEAIRSREEAISRELVTSVDGGPVIQLSWGTFAGHKKHGKKRSKMGRDYLRRRSQWKVLAWGPEGFCRSKKDGGGKEK